MKKTPLLIAIIVLSVCAAGQAFACTCVGRPGTVAEEYGWADAVFEAQVVTISFNDDTWKRLAIVTIERVWKGNPAPSTLVVTERDGAGCGNEFLPGESWLIFGTDSSWEGAQAYYTHICSLTSSGQYAASIIAELETVDVERPTWGGLKAIYR